MSSLFFKRITNRSPQLLLSHARMNAPSRPLSSFAVPSGSWDAHMHVTDLQRFPAIKKANSEYEAQSSTLEGAKANAERTGLTHLAIVQVSTYGKDNSCLLWCLDQLGAQNARGVVDFDPATTPLSTLQQWHAQGVRGVRVNYKSVGVSPSAEDMHARLSALDEAIAPLKTWGIHIHAAIDAMPALKAVIPRLRAKICIDHMGGPPKKFEPAELIESEGWKALVDMIETSDRVWTKVSAPYRYFDAPSDWTKFEAPVRQLLKARRGKGVVIASDWPHTRFESTEIRPWVDYCLEWCGEDVELRDNLFRKNSEALYDV